MEQKLLLSIYRGMRIIDVVDNDINLGMIYIYSYHIIHGNSKDTAVTICELGNFTWPASHYVIASFVKTKL